MTTAAANALTLADWAKRIEPDGGGISDIVELLNQTNEVLMDMTFIQGNLPTGHRTTVRTSLPSVFWRLLNQGVTPSKSTTAQIDEAAGMLESWAEVDCDLAELNGDVAGTRLSEARAFIEAMNQEFVQTLFYGNAGLAAEEFTGFSPRYATLSTTDPVSGNVISAGGSQSDNTSIWLVSWGEDTVTGIFPKGSTAGLRRDDYGEQTITVTTGIAGQRLRAYQERFQWKGGLAIKDYRHAVRIPNIDISTTAASTAYELIGYMNRALDRIPNRLGKPVFYMNRTMKGFLRDQADRKVLAGAGLRYDNYQGQDSILMFHDAPIRTVDQLLDTESVVS